MIAWSMYPPQRDRPHASSNSGVATVSRTENRKRRKQLNSFILLLISNRLEQAVANPHSFRLADDMEGLPFGPF